MTSAIIKISSIEDRLIPLGLACLQAFLKDHDIDLKVFNYRVADYSLPRVVVDPAIQLKPLNFIVNHTDFPLLIPLIDNVVKKIEPDFKEGILADIIRDYSSRLYEDIEVTVQRLVSIIKYIKQVLPDLIGKFSYIGLSVDYINIIETALISAFLKLNDPNLKIIWGGPAITQSFNAFKLFLSRKICDGLVIGEGELPALQFIRGQSLQKIEGIMSLKENTIDDFIYREGKSIDLDLLPTPNYDNIPLDTYYNIVSIYRSRGCTHRCNFCGEWYLFGPKFRVRSIEKVMEDIHTIIKRYNPGYIIFGESLINDELQYFEHLCDAMIENSFNINFGSHFTINITPPLAKKAALSGFNDAWVGLEGFNNKILNEMKKGVMPNQNIKAIELFTQAGINVIAMLVIGYSSKENELENCSSVLKMIDKFSKQRYFSEDGKVKPLPIQWRPTPSFIVPNSIDYKNYKRDYLFPWRANQISSKNMSQLKSLETKLGAIPYEFKRPLDDELLMTIIDRIQEADRKAKFSIGGITQYVIKYIMGQRRQNRRNKKEKKTIGRKPKEVVGVMAQRSKEKKYYD